MLDAALAKKFRRDGFVLIRNGYSPAEIEALRNACYEFHRNGKTHMPVSAFVRSLPLAEVPFQDWVIKGIKSVFGENFSTAQSFAVQANCHDSTWHIDAQSQGSYEYLYEPDYQICKCGIYLQEHSDWGGGLEVVPGSHRPGWLGHKFPFSRPGRQGKISAIQRKARDLRNRFLKPVTLDLKAGDLLIFHACLIHRASTPQGKVMESFRIKEVPVNKVKYLISWEISPRNQYLPVYLAHQRNRAIKQKQDYEDALKTKFPDAYDPSVAQKIREEKLHLSNYGDGPKEYAIGAEFSLNGLTVKMNDPGEYIREGKNQYTATEK